MMMQDDILASELYKIGIMTIVADPTQCWSIHRLRFATVKQCNGDAVLL